MTIRSSLATVLVASLCAVCVGLLKADAVSLRGSGPTCGPDGLLTICRGFGIATDLAELKKLSGFTEHAGTSMLGLKEAAVAKGLCAVGVKIGAEELGRLTCPAIAHEWGEHFVVVNGGELGALRVTDPPSESKLVPLEEFTKSYSGFALLIAKDEKAFPKPVVTGPDLRSDAYSYDFGFIEQGDRAGHVFILKNRGVQELVLSKVETSCTCTTAVLPNESRLPPGGRAELVVGFDSTGREGSESHTVFVHSNDPVSPIVQLRMGGVIRPTRLSASVRTLRFGTVKKRGGAIREFSIRDPGDSSLTVSEVTSGSPLVKATLTRNDKAGIVYLVTAELLSGAPIGEFKGKITVRSNHPREPVVEIPISAEVIGDIETFPNQFFLGVSKKGQGASKTVTVSTTAKERLKIKRIDSPFDYITITSEASGDKYLVTATLKDTVPTGLIKGVVVIRTNDADQPEIGVPIYAFVEE